MEPGQSELRELTISNTGTTSLDWNLVQVDESFHRIGAIALEDGESQVRPAVVDATGKFAYFGTATSPGYVVKVNLETFERVDAIELEAGEDDLRSAVISPAGDYAWFGTGTSPGRVVKIDLNTFERVGGIDLEPGEDNLRTAVIDPAGQFAYFGTRTSPARIVKLDLGMFERTDVIELEYSSTIIERNLRISVMEPSGQYAWFGTETGGWFIRIDLDEFVRDETIQTPLRERHFGSAVIDSAGEFAYIGTYSGLPDEGGRVIKIDLASRTRAGSIVLPHGENSVTAATISPDGEFAWFGTLGEPGKAVRVNLERFERDAGIELEPGENAVMSAITDNNGEFVYFSTGTTPASRIIKVHVRNDDCTPRDWFEVHPDTDTLPPGDSQEVTVSIEPGDSAPGHYSSKLCFESNVPQTSRVVVPLNLEVQQALSFHPDHSDFGDVHISTTAVLEAQLNNHGDSNLTGLEFTIEGERFAADFNECDHEIAAGASCTILVSFTPINTSLRTGAVSVTSDQGLHAALTLSGRGMTAPTQTTWTGAVGSDWFDQGNWDDDLPTAGLDVSVNTNEPDGAGTIIDGADAVSATLTVGNTGSGRLRLLNGGMLNTTGPADLGILSSGAADILVSGQDSRWAVTGHLHAARHGNAVVTVENGGQVESSGNTVNALGWDSGGQGEMVVRGAGSRWDVGEESQITVGGNGGIGSVAIEDGGTISIDGQATLGALNNGTGSLVVSGADSLLEISDRLNVGYAGGTGMLTVEAGGRAHTGNHATLAILGEGAEGNAVITGPGSRWDIEAALSVGGAGTGTLTVSEGGALTSRYANIGNGDNGIGEAVVTGNGSQWTIENELNVGVAGDGGLSLEDGGHITAETVFIARQESGSGFLQLLQGSILEAGRISHGEGSGGGLGIGMALLIDGGRLRATGNQEAWLTGFTSNDSASSNHSMRLASDGALIDTGGYNVGIPADFQTLHQATLTKMGMGTLTLSGYNQVVSSSILEILEGTLAASAPHNLGEGQVVVTDGAALELRVDGGTVHDFDNPINNQGTILIDSEEDSFARLHGPITGPGGVVKTGQGGIALVNPDNNYIGDTVIETGRLHGAGGISQASSVTVKGHGTLYLDTADESIGELSGQGNVLFSPAGPTLSVGAGNTNSQFSGQFSGPDGRLNKIGTGELVLTGHSTAFTGETTVTDGTLIVGTDAQGTLGGSLEVLAGGRLGGNGTVGKTIVRSDGKLSRKGLVGPLHVNDDLILEEGAILDFEFGVPGGNDQVLVGGDLHLNGAVLHVNETGVLTPGIYPLLSYAGSLNGDVLSIGTLPEDFPYEARIVTSAPGEVTLVIRIPGPHFVDAAADGANNGTSWEDAFTDLQDALAAAIEGDEIWVAGGQYQPDSGHSFELVDGVAVFGGFDTSESTLDERDWQTNPTTLAGLNGRVVLASSTGPGTRLDGFTVTGGLATGTGVNGRGGGIYVDGGAPELTNLIIRNNHAGDGGGGGLHVANSSAPLLANVLVSSNESTGSGGGLSIGSSQPVLVNVTFTDNLAGRGGAISTTGSGTEAIVHNTIIWGNQANVAGHEISHLNGIIELRHSLYRTGAGVITGGGDLVVDDESLTEPPLYADPSNGDTRPLPGSPALFAGTATPYEVGGPAEGIESDLGGNPRFVEDMIDIGAWQNPGFELAVWPEQQSTMLGSAYLPLDLELSARTDSGFDNPLSYPIDGAPFTVTYPETGATVAFDGTTDNPLVLAFDGDGNAATPEPVATGQAGEFEIELAVRGAATAIASMTNIPLHTVTATTVEGNGDITPEEQFVVEGEDATFTVTPDIGWHASSLTGNNCTPADQGNNTWVAANITADCHVEAHFELNQYTVSTSMNGHGTITPDSQTVHHGDTATLNVVPDTGYTAFIGGTCPPGELDGYVYVSGPVTADCEVSASFITGVLAAEPADVHFEDVVVTHTRSTEFLIINHAKPGEPPVELSAVVLESGAPAFAIDGITCKSGTVLLPGESCRVKVSFNPLQAIWHDGSVLVSTTDGQTVIVPLSGSVLPDETFHDRFEQSNELP